MTASAPMAMSSAICRAGTTRVTEESCEERPHRPRRRSGAASSSARTRVAAGANAERAQRAWRAPGAPAPGAGRRSRRAVARFLERGRLDDHAPDGRAGGALEDPAAGLRGEGVQQAPRCERADPQSCGERRRVIDDWLCGARMTTGRTGEAIHGDVRGYRELQGVRNGVEVAGGDGYEPGRGWDR